MAKLKISKGYRKYIRQEKARIRREILDLEEQERQIRELYNHIRENQKQSKIRSNV